VRAVQLQEARQEARQQQQPGRPRQLGQQQGPPPPPKAAGPSAAGCLLRGSRGSGTQGRQPSSHMRAGGGTGAKGAAACNSNGKRLRGAGGTSHPAPALVLRSVPVVAPAGTQPGWLPSGIFTQDGRERYSGHCNRCGQVCLVPFQPLQGRAPACCQRCHHKCGRSDRHYY
jgi:hypothetical protein